MSKFKKGLMKRVLAVILSGAMVMSNMTAFASEAPADSGGYIEEVADETGRDDDTEREAADKEEAETVAASESATEDAAAEETTKSEDNASDKKDDTDAGEETTVESDAATDAEVSDEEQTSEAESDLSAETEEEKTEKETEEIDETLKAYTPPAADANGQWPMYADVFRSSIFGYNNGDRAKNYILGQDASGNMRVRAWDGKSKTTNTNDGRAMYFYQVKAGTPFSLTATATISDLNSTDSNIGQAAFGLMARDDMCIDTNNNVNSNDASYVEGETDISGALSNYVVAGTFGKSSVNCFSRSTAKSLTKGPALAANVQKSEAYSLSIVFDGSQYVCTFGENESQTYQVDLTQIDSEYDYIGMSAFLDANIPI